MRRIFRTGAADGRAPSRPSVPGATESGEGSALVRLVPADEAAAAADPTGNAAPTTTATGTRAEHRAGAVRFPSPGTAPTPLVRARGAVTTTASASAPAAGDEAGAIDTLAGPTDELPADAEGDPPDGDPPGDDIRIVADDGAPADAAEPVVAPPPPPPPPPPGAGTGRGERRGRPRLRDLAERARGGAAGERGDEGGPPAGGPEPVADADGEPIAGAEPPDGADDARITVEGPASATVLPHWTQPAGTLDDDLPRTPRPGAGAESGAGDAPTARWRSGSDDWSDSDAPFADLALGDDPAYGALSSRPRREDDVVDEDYLTFEDLDVPVADVPSAPTRGSADDPIYRRRTGADRVDEPDVPGYEDGEAAGALDGVPDGQEADGDRRRPGPPDEGSPPPGGRDRSQAIVVGVLLAAGCLAIFLVGALTPLRWLPLVLIVAAAVGAMTELYSATIRGGYRPASLVGIAAAVAMPVAAYLAGTPANPAGESGMVMVLFASVAATMAWFLFGAGRGRPLPNIAVTILGVVYIAVLGSYAALLLRAGPWPGSGTSKDQGVPFFVLIAVGTAIYDAAGYLLGSRLGRTPLSAASPNKTREGLVMGMAGAVASVLLIGGVFQVGVRTVGEAAILGLVIAVVAPLGDLFESLLKRDLGVKDMGSLLPSHGGLLDRVDALLFTLPAGYYTLRLLGLL